VTPARRRSILYKGVEVYTTSVVKDSN
jgi:hypothetical protein